MLVLACARHPVSASGNQPALRDAVLSGIRRPAPRQFAEPEAVVRFVLQQVAARDFSEVTRAFPILESYERITPEVYAKMSTTLPEKIAPQEKITPLDDGAYDRLITIVNRSLNEYREVGNKLLADELAAYGAGDREKRIAETLRLYDGARLKGLQVVSIKANAQAMALNPF
ncbi:MAG TPA: hypothetical protein VN903_22455, partial [Polyangia bacterium]|nr:hypothetical protein [Polyangia bacterium]